MKAIICTRYGPPEVLQLKEVEKPIPRHNEVLIRVHAATVTKGDCELRSLKLSTLWKLFIRIGFGFRAPRRKILGQELAGEIESVGNTVTRFKREATKSSQIPVFISGPTRSTTACLKQD